MKVTVLLENDLAKEGLTAAHGLSLYIESEEEKLLFDFGPDASFLDNAKNLGVHLEEVTKAFLSHGHQDHSGGLKAFLSVNDKAQVYIHEEAFLPHFSKQENGVLKDIGLAKDYKNHPQVEVVKEDLAVSPRLHLMSKISLEEMMPPGNETLYMEKDGRVLPDDFHHEQNLLLEERGQYFLFTGCGHRGILNVLEAVEEKKIEVAAVFGGFHVKKPSKIHKDDTYVPRLAKRLRERDTLYYTCHCTGLKMYQRLHETLRDQVAYISTGEEITLE